MTLGSRGRESAAEVAACRRREQFDAIALLHRAATRHERVERKLPVEPADDAAKDVPILLERIRIERRHHTTAAQILDPDEDVADSQTTPLPGPLLEPLDAADHEVRSQTPPAVAKRGDCSVGGHEQRKYVKPLGAVVPDQSCARTCDLFHGTTRPLAAPGRTVYERFSIRAEDRMVSEKPWMSAGGDDPATRVFYMHDTVAQQSEVTDVHTGEPLTRH